MITGFKLRIDSEELKMHCIERAKYHNTRADEKESQLPKLRESMETLRDVCSAPKATKVSNMSKGMTYQSDMNSPVEDLESDITAHRNKALVFNFFANHLFDEIYILDESDLTRLEITKRV